MEVPSLSLVAKATAAQLLLNHRLCVTASDKNRLIRQLQSDLFHPVTGSLLDYIVSWYGSKVTDSLLIALVPTHAKELKLKSCSSVTWKGVIEVLKKCEYLESIDLSGCNNIVYCMFFKLCAQVSQRITSFTLEGCENVDDDVVHTILRYHQNLEHLNIAMCPNVSDKVFLVDEAKQLGQTQNGQYLSRLKSVDISGCANVHSTCIRHLTSLCGPFLRTLNIAWTDIDCTALWYLSGYSLSTAVHLAIEVDREKGNMHVHKDGSSQEIASQEVLRSSQQGDTKDHANIVPGRMKIDRGLIQHVASGANEDNGIPNHTGTVKVNTTFKMRSIDLDDEETLQPHHWTCCLEKELTWAFNTTSSIERHGVDAIRVIIEDQPHSNSAVDAIDPIRLNQGSAQNNIHDSLRGTGVNSIALTAQSANDCNRDSSISVSHELDSILPDTTRPNKNDFQESCDVSQIIDCDVPQITACDVPQITVCDVPQIIECDVSQITLGINDEDTHLECSDPVTDGEYADTSISLNTPAKDSFSAQHAHGDEAGLCINELMTKSIECVQNYVHDDEPKSSSCLHNVIQDAANSLTAESSSSVDQDLSSKGEILETTCTQSNAGTIDNDIQEDSNTCNGFLAEGGLLNDVKAPDNMVQLYQPNMSTLDMSNIEFYSREHGESSLKAFFATNKNVTKFSISWKELSDDIINFVADNAPGLSGISLVDCEQLTSVGIAYLGLKCRKLHQIDLKGVYVLSDAAIHPFISDGRMTCLGLAECNITDLTLERIRDKNKDELTKLDLSWCDEEITEEGLDTIANSCCSLQVIDLRHCQASGSTLAHLADNCHGLQSVGLSSVGTICDSDVMPLMRSLKLLHSLDLSWNSDLTNKSVETALRCCVYLKELILAGIKQLTSAAFLPLISDVAKWRKSQALLRFKLFEKKNTVSEETYSSDDEYCDMWLPYRSTCYAPSLRYIDLEYCDMVNDTHLSEIVAVCRGSMSIRGYNAETIQGAWVTSENGKVFILDTLNNLNNFRAMKA